MKKTSILLIISFLSILTFAHEFWLEPQKFILKAGEKTGFRVFVGENFHGEKVDFSKFFVSKFTHFSKAKIESKNGKLTEQNLSDFLKFETEGNHLIAFNNSNKFIELPPEKFNAYLKEDGLENVLKMRKERGELNKKGREFYQRCVKTLLQVGQNHDEIFKRNTEMRLELIPEENPYENGCKSLTFKVLFDNKPLANNLVVVWQKGISKTTAMKKYHSDAEGKIKFPLTQKGIWMVSTVRMVEHPNKQEADWQSYWGSYTFGFSAF